MAATIVKTDPIKNDKMNFRTQMVNGKPQIFFDQIDDSSTRTRSKRTSRTMSNASRLLEQQKGRINQQKLPVQNGTNKQTTRIEEPSNKIRVKEDGSTLGVYMTMDELTELVKAVKAETNTAKEIQVEPSAPRQQQQQYTETSTAPIVPKLDLPAEPPPPTTTNISPREQALGTMAEKKRQKWMREKAEFEKMQMEIEYDQLKHQLSPRHKKNSVSPERSTFQYDFPPSTNKPPTVPSISKPPLAPPLPQALKQNEPHYDVSPKVNEDPNNDALKQRLLEKKQQQWKQENSEKMPVWNPFGRPGAGAPNPNENQARTSQAPANPVVPYRPPIPHQHSDSSSSSLPSTYIHSDQTHVPAAMRTNLLFGDVRFDNDIQTAKEIERRQWLDDLQKQVEDNKRQKYTRQETERRQDFLNENVQPILQEAANRHQQYDAMVQSTSDKGLEGGDPAKHDKRAQLFDKLKRNGYPTESLTKIIPNGQSTNERTGEKLFGPSYESSSRQNANNKVEQLHVNAAVDQQQAYRPFDTRRDEAVNTVGSTFRSDHSVQTDLRIPPHRHATPHAYEESDLPPQNPNHHYQNSGYRNIPNQPGKNNPRMRSLDDHHLNRRTSTTTYHSNPNDDRTISQISQSRNNHPPMGIHERPLWNFKNPAHREYIPNSKRDPHYEKRQRLKHFEQGHFDRIDDVQKKTCYNRWNSDSEIQQQQKKTIPTNRVRSTISKATSFGNHKDESILNLLKMQHKQQHEAFGTRKSAVNHARTDEDFHSNHESALDKYESYVPYTRTDEVVDSGKVHSPNSQSRETTPQRQSIEVNTENNYQQRDWNDANPSVQQQPSPPPQSRQEHILQQLSTIKENLVRRQRELASSVNPIPV